MHYLDVDLCLFDDRARKMKPLSNRKTLDGIWFLILIIYVYTFDTCFNLLRCVETKVIKMHSNDSDSVMPGPLVRVIGICVVLFFIMLLLSVSGFFL